MLLMFSKPGLHIKDLQMQLDYFYFEMHGKADRIKKVSNLGIDLLELVL